MFSGTYIEFIVESSLFLIKHQRKGFLLGQMSNRKVTSMSNYNKTNLDVYKTLDKNISHRDWYAHLFRWQHVLRIADIGMKILDVGTGPGELFETFYRNRYKPARFLGLDIRKKMIESNVEKWGPHGAEFKAMDVVLDEWDFKDVKLAVWESQNSSPSAVYDDSNLNEVQIGDPPLSEMKTLSLNINTDKSKMKSANLKFEAIGIDPSYYDCVFINGNYIGSVDYQEWNGTNVWQKVLFDVPTAWLNSGLNEVNITSGTTSGCHKTSGNNNEWRFRNLNLTATYTEEPSAYDRTKSMLVMSDGEANTKIGDCAGCDSAGARAETVQKACDAHNLYGISIYAVAFGNVGQTAINNLNQTACCDDCSHFYTSNSSDELIEIYAKIAQSVGNISYQSQSVNISSGNLGRTRLYPDSYLAFNYTPLEAQFNKIPLGFETERFGNNISSGTLDIYPNTSISEAKVTSYSGNKWTDNLVVNGNTVYRLSDYGNNYQILGDPFAVNIPVDNINQGSNSITISTGINSTTSTGGSNDSRVIYTLLLNSFADYSSVVAKSDGCSWTVSFEEGTAATIKVPPNYNGADLCSFASKTYDTNDALDNAVFKLFSNLDIDKDGKLEVNIDSSNLEVNTLTISKVPSLWGPAIIEVRVWE